MEKNMLKSRKKLKLSESNLAPDKDSSQAYVFDEKEYKKLKRKIEVKEDDRVGIKGFDADEYLQSIRQQYASKDEMQGDKINATEETKNSENNTNQSNDFEFDRVTNSDESNSKDNPSPEKEKADDKANTDDKEILKTKKKRKLSKPKKALIIGSSLLVVGVGLYLLINNILAYFNNQNPGIQDNFSNNQIIINNGNDLVFDDSGQIVVDPITDEEKVILVNSLTSKLLNDANKRLINPVSSIDEIKLISLMPSNDCVGLNPENPSNIYDKYYLTLLFTSQGKTYQMSYLTGKEFQSSNLSVDKNLFSAFVQYIQNDCAIDNCQILDSNNFSATSNNTQIKEDILSTIGVHGYVGDVYYAFTQIGDLCYNIPVYIQNENGDLSANVYSCIAQYIDNYELDATETLAKELKGEALPPLPEEQEHYFTRIQIEKQSSFTNILNLFDQFTNPEIYEDDIELES